MAKPPTIIIPGNMRARSDAAVQPLARPAPAAPGFVLPEHVRQAFSSRLMVQAPANLTPKQIGRIRDDLDRRVRGMEPGMFMALDGLRLLADQGNEVAKTLFDSECRRLGLISRTYSMPR
jgi:hypothetical protein